MSYNRLKVDRKWHITCDYQYYSVPFQLVGEIRGAEVVDLLAALNTGHDGGAGTLHANSVWGHNRLWYQVDAGLLK